MENTAAHHNFIILLYFISMWMKNVCDHIIEWKFAHLKHNMSLAIPKQVLEILMSKFLDLYSCAESQNCFLIMLKNI